MAGRNAAAILGAEVRYAIRRLRHSPWYAAGVIGVLALGLALATVTFAVVDGVLFKPLPYERPQELFIVRADVTTDPRPDVPLVSEPEIAAWAEALADVPMTVVDLGRLPDTRGKRERVSAAIDEHFFSVLGVRPVLGGFQSSDFDVTWREQPVSLQPTLISYSTWQHEYGGDPNVVGRIVITRTAEGGRQYGWRIAGVLPETFVLPIDGREVGDLSPLGRGLARSGLVVARLPATRVVEVQTRLVAATRRAAEQAPIADAHGAGQRRQQQPFDTVKLIPVSQHLSSRERPAFVLVFSATALLLLLASLNVAGLAAARNVERRADLAICRALGASRAVILRGLLVEMALLTAIALGGALLIAKPMLVWTVDLLPASVSVLKEPTLDPRVFAASAILAAICLAVVTVWPAFVSIRPDPRLSLQASAHSTPRGRRSRAVLVGSQVAIGFVLLTTGGLTIAGVAAAYRNDTGYRRDHAVLLEVFAQKPSGSATAVETLRSLQTILTNLPGVEAVATSTISPLFAQRANAWTEVMPENWTGELQGVVSRQVSANFFTVLGARLAAGRWPSHAEWTADQPVALVSETAARTMWPDRAAVGQTLVARSRSTKPVRRMVIGVVADARYAGLDAAPVGDIYLPDPLASAARSGVFFHVTTKGPAADALPAILTALGGRGLLIAQATTHEDALFASVKHRILPAWLFGSLGVGALVMLGASVLGLLAMTVAQRTREIGIRMALGATPARVVGLLLGEQLAAVVCGLTAGVAMSAWAVRLLESQLYGVRAYDAGIWIAVAVALAGVAGLGAFLPCVRATRVDPAVTLRES